MKKTLFILLPFIVIFLSTTANAQMLYMATYDTSTYVPLTGATSLSGATPWDSTSFYAAPLGFNFNVGPTVLTNFFLDLTFGVDFITDTTGMVSMTDFQVQDAPLIDRGIMGSASLSPIRYITTGSTGNHIFKAEISNAGFLDELDSFHTLNDSVSMQIWLYEADNSIEFHYGPSHISYPGLYYYPGGTETGYYPNLDTSGNGSLYLLEGNPTPSMPYPASMTLDTLINPLSQGLSSYPPGGTVYRFAPNTHLAVPNVAENNGLVIYPTICNENINIIYNSENNETSYAVITMAGAATGIKGTVLAGNNQVDVSSLPTGIYLLQAQNSKGKTVTKFIKE